MIERGPWQTASEDDRLFRTAMPDDELTGDRVTDGQVRRAGQTGRSDDRVTDVRVTDDRVTNDRGTNDRGTGVQVIRCKYKTTMMFCFKTVFT